MAPALRMPALGSNMMSLPATLRRDRACHQNSALPCQKGL